MVINPYEPFNKDQQWVFRGRRIKNRRSYRQVIQLASDPAEVGSHVTWAVEQKGLESQYWHIEHLYV